MSTGHKVGKHRIQGISRRVHPPHRRPRPSSITSSPSTTAIRSSWPRSWPPSSASAVGISSGANFLGALMVQNELGPRGGRRHGLLRRQQEVPEHGPAPGGARQGRLPQPPGQAPWLPGLQARLPDVLRSGDLRRRPSGRDPARGARASPPALGAFRASIRLRIDGPGRPGHRRAAGRR